MRTFDQWVIEEGLMDLAAPVRWVYKIAKEAGRLADQGLEGVLIYVRDNYPDIWSKLQKLAGDPGAIGSLDTKLATAKTEGKVGKPVSEATGNPTIDAFQQLSQMLGSIYPILSGVGYGVAAILAIWIALRYQTNLASVARSVVDVGSKAAEKVGLKKGPEDPALVKSREDRARRDALRAAQKTQAPAPTVAPKRVGLPKSPPSMIPTPKKAPADF